MSGITVINRDNRHLPEVVIPLKIKCGIEWLIKSDDTLLFPLHLAVINRDYSLVNKLLQEGNTDINVGNLFDLTPLELAIIGKDPEMIKLLISCDASSRTDKYGIDTIQLVKYLDNPEIKKIFGLLLN